jgi:hypothetical protein
MVCQHGAQIGILGGDQQVRHRNDHGLLGDANIGNGLISHGSIGIWDEAQELSAFEEIAKKVPDHDWRHHLDLPLRSAVYQRHDDGKWVLIERGEGFV